MDMQNVSNLVIPEGEVRTIHNEANQQLWGKVNYSVKYAGDAFQQTYSGKNLLTGGYSTGTDQLITHTWNNVYVTLSGTAGNTYSSIIPANSDIPISSGTYVFSTDKTSTQFTKNIRVRYGGTNYNYSIAKNATSISFTIPNDATDAVIRLLYIDGFTVNTAISDTFGLMLESGSTPTSFEPYTAGPAPNPDYPQAINVVTGTQMVTLSDGVVSEAYTVDLGSTELCKLGTYQDYIYKSGDDWYVHKNCGKVIFNGTENWSLSSNYTNNSRFTCQDVFAKHPSPSPILSNYFTEGVAGTDTQNICVNGSTGKIMVTIANSKATTAPGLTTWLSTHNTTVYYVLTTTTDTKITDAALISQLNAIHQFLTRYGYDATVSGNLPLIVDKTNL